MKKLFIIIIAFIMAFGGYNAFWYWKTHSLYAPYISGMKHTDTFTYVGTDNEGFGYTVSFPGYLYYHTGCLSVTDSADNCSLIIWPEYGKKAYEYGLILNYKGEGYQVEATKDKKARHKYEQRVIDANSDVVDTLYEKAEDKWGNSVMR